VPQSLFYAGLGTAIKESRGGGETMSAAAVAAICIAVFVYIELAVGFGYYMFLLTLGKTADADEAQKRQIRKYSIIAGAAFPVTFAIIIASRAAERK